MTYDEFLKLPENERRDAYAELSDHDKFLVRISMNSGVTSIDNARQQTPNELAESRKELLRMIKKFSKKDI